MQRGRVLATVVVILAWSLAWWAPWQHSLVGAPWLRSAIAVLLFSIPGLCVHALLRAGCEEQERLSIPTGFALSVAFTGLLGFCGSLTRLPTHLVSDTLGAGGVVGLAILAWRGGLAKAWRGMRPTLEGWLTAAALLVMAAVVARLCLAPVTGADDLTYVARITAFQQWPRLGLQGIAMGEPIISPRHWLEFWTLCEAILATKSGVHGLELTTIYLGPLLGALTVVAVFELSRALRLGAALSLFAVSAQTVSLLFLLGRDQPGRVFFDRLTEDKFIALFLLAPVVFRLLVAYLDAPTRKTLAAATLGWLALAFTHPTSLGMVFLVTMIFGVAEIAAERRRTAALALAVFVALTAAAASVRFVPHPAQGRVYFDLDQAERSDDVRGARKRRVDRLANTRFYGIGQAAAPPLAKNLGLAVLVLALLRWRRDRAARFLVAALGVTALAIVPYSGWLLGLLLTPFQLWRIPALVPFGIGFAFAIALALRALGRLGSVKPRWWSEAYVLLLGSIASLVLLLGTAAYAAAHPERIGLTSLRLADGWRDQVVLRARTNRARWVLRYADLHAIGAALEEAASPGSVVLGGAGINNLIPSLSAKVRVVVFRSPAQTTMHSDIALEDSRALWNSYDRLLRGKLSSDEAVAFLREHQVDFALTIDSAAWLDAIPKDAVERAAIATAGPLTLYRLRTWDRRQPPA